MIVWFGIIIVIVGSIGLGKLILVLLICWFYDVIVGVVLVDGVDVCEYYIEWFWLVIGLVF